MIRFWHIFTKVTGWPVQFVCFRTKTYYENPGVQKRRIKGPAIIICNHTSIFDYAVLMFVFIGRTLRCQMAEVLFERPMLGRFLRHLGGIYVNRRSGTFGFIGESVRILEKGGVVEIFPEGRLPLKGEERPLPFSESCARIAAETGVQVIPVYTDGSYFSKKRAHVIIGVPINPDEITGGTEDIRERTKILTGVFRDRVIRLGKLLDEKTGK